MIGDGPNVARASAGPPRWDANLAQLCAPTLKLAVSLPVYLSGFLPTEPESTFMQAASSRVAPPSPFRGLPFIVEHRASRAAPIVLLLLLIPALAAVVLPLGLTLAFAPHDLWDAVAHKPVSATVLGAGLIAWLGLLLAAGRRLLSHLGSSRRVRIDAQHVEIVQKTLFRSRQWAAPLAEFTGLAHHVRTTLSGVRHELILVHPSREGSMVLLSAHAIGQATIDEAARLFRLPQIPALPKQHKAQRGMESSVVEALPQTA
jgi:hypothetical protein